MRPSQRWHNIHIQPVPKNYRTVNPADSIAGSDLWHRCNLSRCSRNRQLARSRSHRGDSSQGRWAWSSILCPDMLSQWLHLGSCKGIGIEAGLTAGQQPPSPQQVSLSTQKVLVQQTELLGLQKGAS